MINNNEEIKYHPNFEKYTEFIVNHSSYSDLFFERSEDGKVKWVVTGKSAKGQKRQEWWDKQCINYGIPIQKGCYATIARKIHPTGMHVCQCCGEAKSIFYEYPSKRTVSILNEILGLDIDKDNDIERVEFTIKEIVENHCVNQLQLQNLAKAFNLPTPKDKNELINSIYSELVHKESAFFSPGVMSNSPDRFDGFHSYGLCFRTTFDTGRQPENMQTYTQDRRAYEEWSDGNYNLANRLMGEFHKQPEMECPICGKVSKMSADHIGPISLGFCHSIHFAPMCNSCNSSKNNRFTKADVDTLIKLEKEGETVISWHSKYIWDKIKCQIKDDKDAKFASSVMAKCHQNVLNILALIYKHTGRNLLIRYLHPKYSLIDYRFSNVDLHNLKDINIHWETLDSKNKRNNQERYIRIAFDSLKEFLKKENRKNYFLVNEDTQELKDIIDNVRWGRLVLADGLLGILISKISNEILKREVDARIDRISYEWDTEYEPALAAEPTPED